MAKSLKPPPVPKPASGRGARRNQVPSRVEVFIKCPTRTKNHVTNKRKPSRAPPRRKVRFDLPQSQENTAVEPAKPLESATNERATRSTAENPLADTGGGLIRPRAPGGPAGDSHGGSPPIFRTPPPKYGSPGPPGYAADGNAGGHCGDTDDEGDDCDNAKLFHWHDHCTALRNCVQDPAAGPGHAANHPFTICNHCRVLILDDNGIRNEVMTKFQGCIYEQRGGTGRFELQRDPGTLQWKQMQAFLCTHCEEDEMTHWRRKEQDAAYLVANPPPPNAWDGHHCECTCAKEVLDPHYCFQCMRDITDRLVAQAGANGTMLHRAARDTQGRRGTAYFMYQTRRTTTLRHLACRCGREVRRPDEGGWSPRATFCLACSGVTVHVRDRQSLRTRAGTPLMNLAANYPLAHAGGVLNGDVDLRTVANGP